MSYRDYIHPRQFAEVNASQLSQQTHHEGMGYLHGEGGLLLHNKGSVNHDTMAMRANISATQVPNKGGVKSISIGHPPSAHPPDDGTFYHGPMHLGDYN